MLPLLRVAHPPLKKPLVSWCYVLVIIDTNATFHLQQFVPHFENHSTAYAIMHLHDRMLNDLHMSQWEGGALNFFFS